MQAGRTRDSRSQFKHSAGYTGSRQQSLASHKPNIVQAGGERERFRHSHESGRPKGRFTENRSQVPREIVNSHHSRSRGQHGGRRESSCCQHMGLH